MHTFHSVSTSCTRVRTHAHTRARARTRTHTHTHTHAIGNCSGSVRMRLSSSHSISWERMSSNIESYHSTISIRLHNSVQLKNIPVFLVLVWSTLKRCAAYLITLLAICVIWVAVVGPARGSYTEKNINTRSHSETTWPKSVKPGAYYIHIIFL